MNNRITILFVITTMVISVITQSCINENFATKSSTEENVTKQIKMLEKRVFEAKNKYKNSVSLLQMAIIDNNESLSFMIIHNRPNELFAVDGQGTNALWYAVLRQYPDLVSALLKAGVSPNMSHRNPLVMAVEKGNLELVRMLVEAGADVNGRDPKGNTMHGVTPLFMADDLAIASYLIKHGADVNATPIKLTGAIMVHDLNMVVLLVTNGANVTPRECDLARREGNAQIIVYLQKHCTTKTP